MTRYILSVAMALGIALGGGLAAAHQYKAGEVEVLHPWTRATPPGAQTAGGYLKLRNTGTTADQLIGGRSPIADRVEMHSMTTEDGVMRMRPVKGGVTVPPGETVALDPGGIHIMLIGIKSPLKPGERAPLTLEFRNAGTVDVELVIEELGSRGPAEKNKEHSH